MAPERDTWKLAVPVRLRSPPTKMLLPCCQALADTAPHGKSPRHRCRRSLCPQSLVLNSWPEGRRLARAMRAPAAARPLGGSPDRLNSDLLAFGRSGLTLST